MLDGCNEGLDEGTEAPKGLPLRDVLVPSRPFH